MRDQTIPTAALAGKFYLGESSAAVLERVPSGAARILDVGCGGGGTARLLSARGQRVDGVTLSIGEADEATKYCDHVYAHNLEHGLPDLPAGQRYDAVICSHILEHIAYPDRLLRDIRRCLAATGILIVALPNLLLWKNRLRMLLGKFEYTETGLMDYTHVRWYSFTSARRLLERHGFVVEEATVDGGMPLGPLRRILPRRIVAPADQFACAMAPGLVGYEMLYVARPAPSGRPEQL